MKKSSSFILVLLCFWQIPKCQEISPPPLAAAAVDRAKVPVPELHPHLRGAVHRVGPVHRHVLLPVVGSLRVCARLCEGGLVLGEE